MERALISRAAAAMGWPIQASKKRSVTQALPRDGTALAL
jgi:hypothetical protein